jgi:5-methylthioadenosine/S-adenosylhomocysteine deaminase
MEMQEHTQVDLLIRNGYVITMDQDRNVFTKGYVAIQDGKITAVGKDEDCAYTAREEIDANGFVVMPGLVNSHTHLVQSSIKGMAEGTDFVERVYGYYFPMTGRCDEQRSYDAARMTLLELVKGGVTTTADDHFTHFHKDSIDGVLRAVLDGGMRAHSCRLVNNDPDLMPEGYREEIAAGLQEVDRVRSKYVSDFIKIGTGPIGIGYVTSEKELLEIKEYVDAVGCTFSIHAPSARDREILPKRGWDGGSFEYLDHVGLLTEKVLAPHAQRVSSREIELMGERGIRVAPCPDMDFTFAEYTLAPFLKAGVKVGIGIDGPVIANHQNLWTEIRATLIGHRVHDMYRKNQEFDPEYYRYPRTGFNLQFGTPEMALELATLGGARALGWDREIGSLETGKFADLILIDTDKPYLNPRGRLVTLLVFAGNPEMVDTVIINGKVVVRGGKHQIWDEAEVVRCANELQQTLVKEAGVEHFMPLRGSTWNYV